uniref:Uncharacterized protein n=1 Tax=Amphimedon queenslandica TaxID=400682 RepID=A0A1X7V2Q7_AMPQE
MTEDFHYQLSRRSTKSLIKSLKRQKDFVYDIHIDNLISAHDKLFKIKDQRLEETFTATIKGLDKMQQRAIKRAKDSKISLWLNGFRDALAIWYWKPLLNIPAHCDGCDSPFDLSQALMP